MKRFLSFTVRDICEIAMLISLTIVLGLFCKIKLGVNGGSIGFFMIPLFLICYRHGVLKGFVAAGIIYGLISCTFDGYGFGAYPFDYLLAYGSLSISGFFYKPIFESESKIKPYLYIIISILVSCTIRLAFHTLSGMLLWELDFVGSLIYNLLYVGPSCLLCIIVFCAFFKSLKFLNNKFPVEKRI